MPEIKFAHIVSCSSEDKDNPSKNLLKADGAFKWKCANRGEKQASVVIQFEKSSQIHSIDIGNEGAAFVEVLVGKSTAASDQDYEVILVASTFMTPIESKNGTNRNGVRMFGTEKMSKAVSDKNWDRVKIVCTQPFNKNTTYGLSFIRFNSPPDGKAENTETGGKTFGIFKVKAEGKEEMKVGSLFAKRKEHVDTTPPTGAAAARIASKIAESSQSISASPTLSRTMSTPKASETVATTARNTPASVKKENSTSTPSPRKRKHSVSDDDESAVTTPSATPKPSLARKTTSISSSSSASRDATTPTLKKTKSEPPRKSAAKNLKEVMKKVVFVISGFQNPTRGEIREKALEMGAQYRSDWGRGCTHLVCAFANTPKYNQVNGRGKIIKKEWIFDCHKNKMLLPWKKYRLGDADSPSDSSEDEEEAPPPPTPKPKKTISKPTKPSPSVAVDYGGSTDEGDTDDEIRRAKEKAEKKDATPVKKTPNKASPPKKQSDDLYGASTDEDEPAKKPTATADNSSDSGLPDLPDFFDGQNFLLYGDFPPIDRRLLMRYIAAYNGEVEEYMSDQVNFVVSFSQWDEKFEQALSDYPSLVFVKPKWIYVCHEKQKKVPHQMYVIVPD